MKTALVFFLFSGQNNVDDTIAILNTRNRNSPEAPEPVYGQTSPNDTANVSIISHDDSGNDVSVDERPVSRTSIEVLPFF